MSNLSQFFRGETIPITVTPAAGKTMTNVGMLVYPDNLDLNNPDNASKVIAVTNPTQSGSSFVFSIPPATTKTMDAGPYTIELYYGFVTIVRTNNAFTLVESAYALTNAAQNATPSEPQQQQNEV